MSAAADHSQGHQELLQGQELSPVLTAGAMLSQNSDLPADHMFSALLKVGLVTDMLCLFSKERKQFHTLVSLGSNVCGHPTIVHGGLTAAVIDETLGGLAYILKREGIMGAGPAFTVHLEVDYKKPVPADSNIICSSELEQLDGRKAWYEQHLRAASTVCERGLAVAFDRGCCVSGLAALAHPAVAATTRLAARFKGSKQASRTARLIAASSVCGAVFVSLYVRLRWTTVPVTTGPSWTWLFGAVLGLVYALQLFVRNEDVLSFPLVQRPRPFRVKQHLSAAAFAALRVAGLAWLFTWGLTAALPWRIASLWGRNTLPSLLTGTFVAFCWTLGGYLVNIIWTERLLFARPGDPDPNRMLLVALQTDQEPLLQEAAFQDLASLAEVEPSIAWRRAEIFRDDSGAAWALLARLCLEEVDSMTKVVSGVLPQTQSRASDAVGVPPSPARWNALPASLKATPSIGRPQALARWYVRAHYQRATTCIRILAALTAASRTEDKYGLLQLGEPSLATVTVSLLAALLAVQQYVKYMASITPKAAALAKALRNSPDLSAGAVSTQSIDLPAYALQDVAQTGVYRLVHAFGADLTRVVQSSRSAPPHGSPAELAGLLQRCLQYQE
ncbi:hypothetical protein WJX72_002389 [[Myrmecia] bisecta]|uniref:Thioesterase domain-containing protein n=1 Tax=[Myrmecia] bisecta TaxID=41462 RepID=A0AAW1Q7B8_9CHLO